MPWQMVLSIFIDIKEETDEGGSISLLPAGVDYSFREPLDRYKGGRSSFHLIETLM